ncbi:unnamed protein product [Hydatigera taeniaeformis]|uniref:Secreted protein n=1 Tax=Hydatigena taeniaeformis TaxID=6205 RepID=A0A0R3XDM5_HYDTA|nr:unnamed protein product [Hydatigera taeniaeformis]
MARVLFSLTCISHFFASILPILYPLYKAATAHTTLFSSIQPAMTSAVNNAKSKAGPNETVGSLRKSATTTTTTTSHPPTHGIECSLTVKASGDYGSDAHPGVIVVHLACSTIVTACLEIA